MRTRRLLPVCVVAVVATTLVAGSAFAKPGVAAAPSDLRAFLLRANEPVVHEFPRTPAFSWRPVRGAVLYEFQLAKTPSFAEGSRFWSTWVRTPATAIPVALPWMTGEPYAAYARVRARTTNGVTGWSKAFGFNIRWSTTPAMLPTSPGLSRWSPVEGATSYHVWFVDISKRIQTRTNAVDHREFYAFHRTQQWMGNVRWRVRAVRSIYGQLPSGLPRVTYGPWSPIYVSRNPAPSTGSLRAVSAVSEQGTLSTKVRPAVHELTPALTFDGDTALNGGRYELFRPYAFSDRDCVNVIFRGAVVGSPAYAPRMTGPLALPVTGKALGEAAAGYLPDGQEGATFMADLAAVKTTESDKPATDESAKDEDKGKDDKSETSSPEDSLPSLPASTGAPVDLWDSGWPNGRFYWTVVPVVPRVSISKTTTLSAAVPAGATTITVQSAEGISSGGVIEIGVGATAETAKVEDVDGLRVILTAPLKYAHGAVERVVAGTRMEYWDVELPQDACSAGRVISFGKESSPVVAGTSSAFASGLSPQGRLVAAAGGTPKFFGAPVVAWLPALGADTYQVEWSRKAYPWKAIARRTTQATASLLPVGPGTWFYRVRGVNALLPGTAKGMSWSKPQQLVVSRPTFRVVASR